MNRFFLFLIPILFIPALAKAQGIRGTVIDQDGEPLPFTTIYVQQTGSGSVTNQIGKYELRLSPGTYSISFQFLGYKSEQISVTVASELLTRDIVLQQQAYSLQAAEIDGGKEDPAYKIMRKAIAKSSYHRQQVNHYTCEVYLKGGGRLVDAPWFLEKTLKKEGLDTSATFVTESVSEITYTRPGDYKERVISIRSTGDDQNTSPMNYINSSLYEPEIAGLISPFSPKAFAYYKFKYVSTFSDRGYQINEIQVIPRSRGEDVFAGKIYVVEDLWAIHSIDLYFVIQGIRIEVNQVFAPIKPSVWMPVSHKYDGTGKILGFTFEFQYLATVSKYDITVNNELADTFTVLDEKTEQEAIESRDSKPETDLEKAKKSSEDKLMNGEELTRKELRHLMRQYEKQERQQTDEPAVIQSRDVKIDSTAYGNDSTYWALKRPIPLTVREEKGYDLQDSLAIEQIKREEGDTLNTGKEFKIYDLVWGNRYDLGNDNTLQIKNALASIRFNSVDGWNFKYALSYFKRIDKDRKLEISPVFRYAFARNRGFGTLKSEFSYGKGLMKGSKINVEGGYYYSQFNEREPIATFTDAISSLFVENHFMRVYDKKFIETNWEHRVRHNLKLKPSVIFTERIETFNNTDYVWFDNPKKEYSENAPVSLEMPDTHFGRSRAFKVYLGFTWKPWSRYYKSGETYSKANNPPEINVTYVKAIPGVYESTADYDLAKIEVKYRFDLNLFGKIAVRSEAGKFLRNNTMEFMDYAHFMGNQTIFTRFAQMQGYSIAPYYDYSTNDQYVSTWINYEFRQFLLTNIRVLRLTGVKENININHIITPTVNHYLEVGYSIDNLFRFFRIDVTGAFLDGKYADFRIQLGITTDLISFQ
ncbi:hypothetical protein G3O08_06540 [Cryomorpha ignava]|uniref:Carboxypeptidase-like regulatory domain-containing protein n=1 Tax=Cryomorpha ignava TaxID=101383 RepID=A0A7K3WR15_9FLAO|nr:DUF5686 and carboxypeptidase regulatory-like domain-containing protein [Cryomorpha ignava]NEN23155.1 hypothetical protein [Cryomorpha ignava]